MEATDDQDAGDIERYEQLRARALAGDGAGWQLGLALLQRPGVAAAHLTRTAYLYVRQSSLRQVLHNTESTERQYALRQRAIALGWPAEQIVVIDTDQGHSGASADGREGFQRLVTAIPANSTTVCCSG